MPDESESPEREESSTGEPALSGAEGAAPGRITNEVIEEDLKGAYLTYAMSVIVSRALPDARDGLKPSQRRILYAMHEMNLAPRAKTVKCVAIVGECMKKYHPHGDASIYPTLVRMVQDFSLRVPLIEGQGNFGSIDGHPPAAMRYTEARLTPAAMEMLEDLEQGAVEFVPNYDESDEEPAVLPARLPNLLVNGSLGIAVGMATSIPPHNVGEVCDALLHLLEHPDCSVDDLLRFVQGPDYPTGGILCGRSAIRRVYRTGRGLIPLRARVQIEERAGRSRQKSIVVTEIPYMTTKESLIEHIAAAVDLGRVKGIADIVDESDREGLRIVIQLKRGEDERVVLNQLYEFTPLQATQSIQMIALVGGRPRRLDLKEFLEVFRDHRAEVIRRRTRWLLARAEERLHVIEGLLIALDRIDEVIRTIRAAKDTPSARAALVSGFGLTVRQANAVLEMRLARLTRLEHGTLTEEHRAVGERIAGYRAILADEGRVREIVAADCREIREKYGSARRTQIIGALREMDVEDLIAEEEMAVTVSHAGYVKREALSAYRLQRRGGRGVIGAEMRDQDWTEHLFVASTHETILFFTDQGRAYQLKVHEIPQLARAARGRAIVNLLRLHGDERITSLVPLRSFSGGGYLFMVTARGTVKRCAVGLLENIRRVGIRAIDLAEGDELVGVELTSGGDEVILATAQGKAVRFREDKVRPTSRAAAGVTGARMRQGDRVVALLRPRPDERILTVCRNGYGKRSELEGYRLTSRGTGGVINIRTSKRNGPVVACMAVRDGDEVMVMTGKGLVARMSVDGISVTGRSAQGVKVVTFKEVDDFVAAVARVAREEDGGDAKNVENGENEEAG